LQLHIKYVGCDHLKKPRPTRETSSPNPLRKQPTTSPQPIDPNLKRTHASKHHSTLPNRRGKGRIMSTSTRPTTRPRRIDDALSQLVESLLPEIPLSALPQDHDFSDDDLALAAAEEHRHHAQLERAWRTLEAHPSSGADPTSPAGRRGSSASEDINHAPDLIKRKLRRENASPEKIVRFSNLYTRLLTQPVLSQKWGILYLLYKLSETDEEQQPVERSRSPLMDEGNLQNMLGRGAGRPRRGTVVESEDDEGPAVSSSASQPPRVSRESRAQRPSSLRRDWEESTERASASRASHYETGDERDGMASPTETPASHARSTESVENGLLRDLPFNLQGLSSTNLQFQSTSVLKLPSNLPAPIVSLLNALAEPCLLYKELAGFVESAEGGLVNQSLRAAVANELRSYLGLVATLEAEIRQALAAIGNASTMQGVRKGGVTLKRCMVWTRDATMALRLMSLIVEEARGK
jgi:gamma-tubulin complex component 3